MLFSPLFLKPGGQSEHSKQTDLLRAVYSVFINLKDHLKGIICGFANYEKKKKVQVVPKPRPSLTLGE